MGGSALTRGALSYTPVEGPGRGLICLPFPGRPHERGVAVLVPRQRALSVRFLRALSSQGRGALAVPGQAGAQLSLTHLVIRESSGGLTERWGPVGRTLGPA